MNDNFICDIVNLFSKKKVLNVFISFKKMLGFVNVTDSLSGGKQND